MNFRQRLQRLERTIPDRSCRACCQRRGRVVLVTVKERADSSTEAIDLPTPCSVCGQRPEQIIEIVERIVEASCKKPPRISSPGSGYA